MDKESVNKESVTTSISCMDAAGSCMCHVCNNFVLGIAVACLSWAEFTGGTPTWCRMMSDFTYSYSQIPRIDYD